MRYTEYHAGKAVIKDKNKLSEAMEKLAKLEDAIRIIEGLDTSNSEENIKAKKMAVAAMKKQITKRPITYTSTNRADCPVCGETVRGIDKPYGKYCSGCGQKLDWSDEQ